MFWGVVSSMYIGNVMLLILNIPLIGLFTKITNIPARIIAPFIAVICVIGAYALNNDIMDIFIMTLFGLIGFLMKKFAYPAAPLILGFILGPLLEVSLRQALIVSDGSFLIFFVRPISAILLIAAVVSFAYPLLFFLNRLRHIRH